MRLLLGPPLVACESNSDVLRDVILGAPCNFGEVLDEQSPNVGDLRESHRLQDFQLRPPCPPVPRLGEQPTGFHRRLGVNIPKFRHQ